MSIIQRARNSKGVLDAIIINKASYGWPTEF